jgi:hypothetical protein
MPTRGESGRHLPHLKKETNKDLANFNAATCGNALAAVASSDERQPSESNADEPLRHASC